MRTLGARVIVDDDGEIIRIEIASAHVTISTLFTINDVLIKPEQTHEQTSNAELAGWDGERPEVGDLVGNLPERLESDDGARFECPRCHFEF